VTAVKLSLLSWFHPGDLAGPPLGEARRLAQDRKIVRMLDDVSAAGFVAAVTTLAGVAEQGSDDVALFTVSAWDSSGALPDVADSDDRQGALARTLAASGNPTEWLRTLCNAALCQSAISAKVHGPSAHFVGGAEVVPDMLAMIGQTCVDGLAPVAVLVAFDAGPDGGPGRSAGIALAAAAADADGPVLAVARPQGERSAVDEIVLLIDQATALDADRPILLHLP